MKLALIIGGVVVVLGGILFLSQNNSQPANAVTFSSVEADTANGGQLIDVRTPAEFSAGHIKGAINLSLLDMQAGTMPTVTKSQKIYVYCHSGNRSSQATSILEGAGYQSVTDLGAMSHVQSMGGTLTN